ncbi:MAG TPA: hypothetical protein VJQ54_24980 [Candidatus Sulfotelmatobacter sp.]|nr:hypothetical protein [Candidatus Sulfotelmatobacter sp.]
MPSPKIAETLFALETQKALSLPLAALILGAVSQVEALIELADRVCDPVYGKTVKTTNQVRWSNAALPLRDNDCIL